LQQPKLYQLDSITVTSAIGTTMFFKFIIHVVLIIVQPTSSCPPQPVPWGSAQGSSSQEQVLTTQQAIVINLTGVRRFLQPQAAVLS
jgi:hypothetical protein